MVTETGDMYLGKKLKSDPLFLKVPLYPNFQIFIYHSR